MPNSSSMLIRGGQIVTMDPNLGNFTGDVLIRDGVIAAVSDATLGPAPAVDGSAARIGDI
jgi:cytosine/adenosine deaminase-related metal-dependent hydrolase